MIKHNVKTSRVNLNALVWQEEELFIAKAVEVEIASQGTTMREALSNLEEALELYFEDVKIMDKGLVPTLRNLKLKKIQSISRYA